MELKNNIREKRVSMGFTQGDLAELVQVSKNTISNLERGVFNPTAFLAAKICSVLCCKFEDIFWIDDLFLDADQLNLELQYTLFDEYLFQRDK